MPHDPFSQNDLVQVTREVEVTPGVVVGGDRKRVYGTAPSYTPGSTILTSGINTGKAVVMCVRLGKRFADSDVPSELIFQLNALEQEDFFRQEWPVTEAKDAAVAATWLQAGTHLDSTTGPTITGSFANLVGTEGCMLVTTDPASSGVSAANLRDRAIKAVSASQIDIEPLYTTGAPAAVGEPLADEGPLAADFNVGLVLRDQSIQNIRTVNFEYQFTDQTSGSSFITAVGQKGATWNLAIDGSGNVGQSFTYVGQDFTDLGEVTVGSGTVNDIPARANCNMTSGDDLANFWVAGITEISTEFNLVSFNLSGDGTAAGIDTTAGSVARPAVTVGDAVFTGSMTLLHRHGPMKVLTNLSRAGTIVPVDLKIADPLGNFYWFRLVDTLFSPMGPKPGEKGSNTDGSFDFQLQGGERQGSAQDPVDIRTVNIQAFPKP